MLITVCLFKVAIANQDLANSELQTRVPYMGFLANTTYFMCFEYGFETRLAGLIISGACVLFIGLIMMLYLKLYFQLHQDATKFSIKTHKMQVMLFNATTFQILNYFVTGIVPLLCAAMAFYVQFEFGEETAMISESGMVLHGIIDYFCVVYFITPYRRVVMRWLGLRRNTIVGKSWLITSSGNFVMKSTAVFVVKQSAVRLG
ncbi:unnamed protein product [Bursaphelenchus okinawaensis]|uniref:7TM_GPCR_Srx domain-containing protein n=1 Tax=Bursaphelenchus okinawaensis TaxID=465554 RepID=A0A811KDB8_9BILA|nr:unnamed protein product [Bursaphelenchus okinawaensis]CAG9101585.1 unnamed protein product [Bursaphelenchus okinawaensis]